MKKQTVKKIAAKPEKINPYDLPVLPGWTQLEYDRYAFACRIGLEQGAPRRQDLFKRIADKMLPGHFEWHSWTEKIVNAMVDDPEPGKPKLIRLVGFPGCAGAAKTYNVVSLACVWWLCEPQESSVNLVSTTIGSLRQRGWADVQKCYSELGERRLGNFVDSRLRWQWEKGDDKHAIFGRAVEEGNMQKIADDIKGVHTRRQMIIIDEATRVNEAILEAVGNLYAYPDEFILVLIGNPLNRLDQFGRFCEPDNGWMSVSVDTGEWTAKPFMRCGGARPRVVTFDAERSPNITEGRIVSRHLPKKEEVEAARIASGGGNSPNYWQNKRGFWPPEGVSKTVFTESAIHKFKAKGRHTFNGDNFSIIGTVDPAFGGGDRPVLRFAKLGMIDQPQRSDLIPAGSGSKVWGIEAMAPIILDINATDPNPVRFQLAEQIQRYCEKVMVGPYTMTCPPENLGVDDTGDGGLCDILYRTWSPKVMRIDFRGTPSLAAVSLEDVRPAKDVYKNKRAELYFYARTILDSGQFKGIDDDTAAELVNMEFDMPTGRIVLMDKTDYRVKFGSSPDLADSLVMLPEVARRKGFILTALEKTAETETEMDVSLQKHQEIFDESDEYQPEEDDVLV